MDTDKFSIVTQQENGMLKSFIKSKGEPVQRIKSLEVAHNQLISKKMWSCHGLLSK
jgi:hypothetical protein